MVPSVDQLPFVGWPFCRYCALQSGPQILNRIEIRTVSGPIQQLNFVLLAPCNAFLGSVAGSAILLEIYGVPSPNMSRAEGSTFGLRPS